MFRKVVFGALALVAAGTLVTPVLAAPPGGGRQARVDLSKCSPPSQAGASAAELAQARSRIKDLERNLARGRAGKRGSPPCTAATLAAAALAVAAAAWARRAAAARAPACTLVATNPRTRTRPARGVVRRPPAST